MPQMKPTNWMMLYITLNFILLFMNITNYFININYINTENKNKKTNKKKLNWKW